MLLLLEGCGIVVEEIVYSRRRRDNDAFDIWLPMREGGCAEHLV